ncbi:N-acetylmuramoyl-L-alanine amidase CwlD [Salipaludibacillus keqinensis]|uniref:N-acetylmuramoyl-L-alanine amidase CwlD n=1 Tax=Salipaludibacillus keqinensis TaxID=2045207 RepID=A0A323TA08_9BACI|nr:N-acetylmuramoyl-L-alanine amidase CwlD [Salipaludibacillus keqinensis]PYZ91900.1 N-acetylmuramoyl-L-alanine amidase CwlD [Salipaludibacillus keqinensis]
MKKWWGLASLAFIIAIGLAIGPLLYTTEDSTGYGLPLSGKMIVLDPGHGGIDGGATSKSGLLEKDVSLEISLNLRDYLQEAGAFVMMTREVDKDLAAADTQKIRSRKVEDLKERVRLINNSDADFFISLHLNAIGEPRWSGAQTFYNRAIEGNEVLAKHIQNELVINLENTARQAKPIHNVYLIQQSTIPGSLVEVGFLSNPREAELLGTEDYQQKIAASIYNGILRYTNNEPVTQEGE